MRRLLILLLAVLPLHGVSADGGTRMVERLAETFGRMSSYAVTFRVQSGDYTAEGRYAVRGDAYYLTLGGAEVYSDGRAKREVDPERREVVIDVVDTASRNLLNNPTRAFDFLDDAFRCEESPVREGSCTLRLTPTDRRAVMSTITVEVDVATACPRWVEYDLDGDRVRIDILRIEEGAEVRAFDEAEYAGYEFIDFR